MGPDRKPFEDALVPPNPIPRARAQSYAFARGILVLTAAVMALSVPGCKRSPKAVHVPDMAQGFDASPIAADSLSTQGAARHHVLNMGVPELSHRAESFALRVQTTITLSQDGKPQPPRIHTAVLVQDAVGSLHLQSGNGEHQLELVAVGDKAYVRQDRGHLRRKRRQEVDEVEMAEAAVSDVRELLQHFSGATLVNGTATKWEGREAVRYEVQLEEGTNPELEPQQSLALLPVSAPSRWREEAKHPRLDGKITVDGATGVVVKADMTGVLTVTGPTGQNITLTLRAVHTLTEMGTVAPVKEPKDSIAEVRRPVRPKDPLSFFRVAQKGQMKAQAKQNRDLGEAAVDNDADGRGPPDEELPE